MPLDVQAAKNQMVEGQLKRRGITDARVLAAMGRVPRHAFVPGHLKEVAYEDRPLPIGNGQTISQPLIVALMLQALELVGSETVLDVGTGSGYQAALLCELARDVYSVEIVPALADGARALLAQVGCVNVHVVTCDGSLGWPEASPYDAIVAAAASPRVPPALVEQLADGGRLVLPIGDFEGQELVRIVRHGDDIDRDDLGACAFVPLLGAQGWGAEAPRGPGWNW